MPPLGGAEEHDLYLTGARRVNVFLFFDCGSNVCYNSVFARLSTTVFRMKIDIFGGDELFYFC